MKRVRQIRAVTNKRQARGHALFELQRTTRKQNQPAFAQRLENTCARHVCGASPGVMAAALAASAAEGAEAEPTGPATNGRAGNVLRLGAYKYLPQESPRILRE